MKKSLIFKILYLFLILIVVAGVSVFATTTYLASQVSYGSTNVENALNDLYSINTDIRQTNATSSDILYGKKAYTTEGLITGTLNNECNVEEYSSGIISKSGTGTFWSKELNIGSNVKKVIVYLSVASAYGIDAPTISGEIIKSSNITSLSGGGQAARYTTQFYKIEIETKQNEGIITVNARVCGDHNTFNHIANMVVVYN